jgi:hypothetical protein
MLHNDESGHMNLMGSASSPPSDLVNRPNLLALGRSSSIGSIDVELGLDDYNTGNPEDMPSDELEHLFEDKSSRPSKERLPPIHQLTRSLAGDLFSKPSYKVQDQDQDQPVQRDTSHTTQLPPLRNLPMYPLPEPRGYPPLSYEEGARAEWPEEITRNTRRHQDGEVSSLLAEDGEGENVE